MPDPNQIGVNNLASPLPIGATVAIAGAYTTTTGPISAVNVYRSDDGANTFYLIKSNEAVSGGTFSIPIDITGPAISPVYFKVEDAADSTTSGTSNGIEINGVAAATDWNVASIDITDIAPLGGTKLVLTGNSTDFGANFKTGTYKVHLGPAGNITDPLCYPGIAGGGHSVTLAALAATITIYSPNLDPSLNNKITVVRNDAEFNTLATAITVEQKQFGTLTHKIRKFLPPWMAAGVRNLELES